MRGGAPRGGGGVSSPGASSALTPTATKTANYTAVAGDLVPVSTASGSVTVTLPTGATAGQQVGVYKATTDANTVTVAGTIDGQTNATISYPGSGALPGATFTSLGSNTWKLTSTYTTVGPAGPTGPTGPAGAAGSQPQHGTGFVGNWYISSSVMSTNISNRTMAVGTLHAGTPTIAQSNLTIDKIGFYLQTAAGAGGVARVGIYQIVGSNPYELTFGSTWATLLQELPSTIDTTTGAGAAKSGTLTTPQVITAGTAFVVAVVCQVATAGIYAESTSNNQSPWGSTSAPLNGANCAVTQASVTGALPANLVPAAFYTANFGAVGWYHRSA